MIEGGILEKLTRRQQDVMTYIEEHRATYGYSPTIREIGRGLGIKSSSTVHNHVQKLIDKGHLKQYKKSPRALNPSADEAKHIIQQMKLLGKGQEDLVFLGGEAFWVKRAEMKDFK